MQNRAVILASEHVALVKISVGDQPFFQKWQAENAELRTLIDDPLTPTMEDQMRWFASTKKPDRKMFSIVTVPDEVLIGHGGLRDIDHENGRAQLRITVGNPLYWGKGLGTEATELIVRYGFEKLYLHTIWLTVLATNERAMRSYGKIGFTECERIANNGKERVQMSIERKKLR